MLIGVGTANVTFLSGRNFRDSFADGMTSLEWQWLTAVIDSILPFVEKIKSDQFPQSSTFLVTAKDLMMESASKAIERFLASSSSFLIFA